ncbi:MAG: site-2 protease family protein [Clostridia bacterium]
MYRLLLSNPIEFLGWLVAFLIAIMAHEVAHGYAALKNGDPTAKMSGRMNFNPLSHFDLMGVLMFIMIGFGYAKPVPINPANFHNYRKGYFQVSVAGVLTNLLLAFVAYPLLYLALRYVPDFMLFDDFLRYFLIYLFNVNLWLMIFNLLPIYPLDGFRLVELYTKPQNPYVRFMYKYSNFVILGYLLISMLGFNVVVILSDYVSSGIIWLWGLILP